jgi:hypothetical protein
MRTDIFRTAIVIATAVFAFHVVPVQAASVGHVADVVGSVTLTHANASAPLKAGDAIQQHDIIETTDKSRAKLVFEDKTELVVAGRGKLTIDEFVYNPDKAADNKATLSILGQAFSYAGGLIEKGEKPDVKLNLDFGSIGIRGTKIYRAMTNRECWIYIERGAVDVSNKGGQVHLKSGEGTIMSAQAKAPAPPHIWNAKDLIWIKSQVADPRLHKKDWK